MTVREEILQRVLALTPSDRAFHDDQIEASLPQEGSLDAAVIDEWSEEIDRRLAAYDRGETAAVEMDAVIHRMRQALAARRAAP